MIEPRKVGGLVHATGLLSWKRETALGFGAAGEVEGLYVDVGDRVVVGQKVATLRRTSVGADATESALARETAQKTFDRVQRLYSSGAASRADFESARLALERTRNLVELAAPAAGVVLKRAAERAQMVNAAQPVVTIGEFASGLIVRAQATSAQAAKIAVGTPVEVKVRGVAVAGQVERIATQSVGATGVFEVEVRIKDAKDLRSGEVAEVDIPTSDTTKAGVPAVLVPAIALTDARADQGMVYVLGADNKVTRRAVQTGGLTPEGVVVISGLAAGDRVVTRGAALVREGDIVTVVSP